MKLFETDESQERIWRMFEEIRAASSLPPDDLGRITFLGPSSDENRQIVCGMVQYRNGAYTSEVSLTFSYGELTEGGVALLARGYGKALARLRRKIPQIKRAAKCLRRINGERESRPLLEVCAVRSGNTYGSHRVIDKRLLSDALMPMKKLSFDYCEIPIDPRTGESETCPHGIRYRWER